MKINHREMGEAIRASYRNITAQYRRDDEIEVKTPNHRRLGHALRQICRSYPRPIHVLEAGCGTGRYFHCLENTERLTGMDISEDMLAAASHPVLAEAICVPDIHLVQQNIFLACFPPSSFDFIYSLGMFGFGCPVTVEICNRFHEWLRPGGKLFFNVVDVAGLRWQYRARRNLRALVYPFLLRPLRRALDERQKRSPFFGLSRRQLLKILSESRFRDFQVESHRCESPLWNGRHLECLATRQ